MIEPARIEAITFDCFGTLIDWEAGILSVLRVLCERYGVRPAPADADLLTLYARLEARAEDGPYRPYREVLAEVAGGVASELGFRLAAADRSLLADSMAEWPAFADTAASLRALKQRFRIGVLSNVDDDLFAGVQPRLGLRGMGGLDLLVTAEQVRSYKPAAGHFEEALRQLGMDRAALLHVAQSKRHDIAPARAMGIRCVWVDRQRGRGGASGEGAATADLDVPDLSTLVRHLIPAV